MYNIATLVSNVAASLDKTKLTQADMERVQRICGGYMQRLLCWMRANMRSGDAGSAHS